MSDKVFVKLIILFLCSSCLTIQNDKLPPIPANELDMTRTDKVKIFSRWRMESTQWDDKQKIMLSALHKKNLEDALERSKCCVIVESLSDADLVFDGTAYFEVPPSAMLAGFLSGLTLFTIPSWSSPHIHIKALVKNGQSEKTYEWKDSYLMIQWLPFIVALPFVDSPAQASKYLEDKVFNHIVLDLKGDSFLQSAPK